jgi:hypothetical protein
MTVKLLLIKSGEDLISDVSEMVIGEDDSKRVVGYYLDKPCVVKIFQKGFSSLDDNKTSGVEVSLHPWIPLTSDEKIPIPADWLITMVEPMPSLKEMYLNSISKYGKKDSENIVLNEQPNPDQQD